MYVFRCAFCFISSLVYVTALLRVENGDSHDVSSRSSIPRLLLFLACTLLLVLRWEFFLENNTIIPREQAVRRWQVLRVTALPPIIHSFSSRIFFFVLFISLIQFWGCRSIHGDRRRRNRPSTSVEEQLARKESYTLLWIRHVERKCRPSQSVLSFLNAALKKYIEERNVKSNILINVGSNR